MASRARIISMRTRRPWGIWSLSALVLCAAAWWLWTNVLHEDAPPRARVELASAWRDSPFAAVRATDAPLPALAELNLPVGSAAPTPRALQYSAPTEEETAQSEEYDTMDAKLKLKPNGPVPEWVGQHDLAAAMSSADPNSTLANFACAEEFCRFDVQSASGIEQYGVVESVIGPLVGQSALMFRFLEDQPNRVVVYLLRPHASDNAQAEPGVNPANSAS